MDRSDEDLLHDLWVAYCTARDAHTRWLRSLVATGLSAQTRRLDEEHAAAEARRQQTCQDVSSTLLVRYRDRELG